MIEESENPMKMTMFRRLILQIVVLVMIGTAVGALQAKAQDPSAPPPPPGQDGPRHGGPGGMRGNQVELLTKKLNLTPDQVTQVKAIEDDSRKQMTALHSDTSLTPDEKKPKMRAIHQASQDKIRALLTDDQKTKYDALQAEMRERMENRHGGPGGPPPPPAPQ
jgi:Spy/CpxP family protein refolding chaperone